ncbi:MAG: HU family DNA-binding protein [Bacteroidales bacterium]|jgi:predicted histone-like DNA-binding protein|nr:HU family DNA-binding protein [Bacteroidales bacterium]
MKKLEFPFVKVMKNQTVGANPGTRYRKQRFNAGRISFDVLVKEITEREGLTRADVSAAVFALTDVIKEKIASGYSVEIGALGTLVPFLKSANKTTLAQVSVDGEDEIHCTFRPSSEFSAFLKNDVTLVEANVDIHGLQS